MKSIRDYYVTGEREIVLATKIGLGVYEKLSRKKQMAPSWLNLSAHLNKSNVGCVPAVVSFFLLSSLFHFFFFFRLSPLVSVCLVLAIFIALEASIHSLVPHKDCFRSPIVVVAPTSLHSTLNVSWWKSLLCRRFYPLPRVNSFERLDSRWLRGSSPRFHWPSTYSIGIHSLEI